MSNEQNRRKHFAHRFSLRGERVHGAETDREEHRLERHCRRRHARYASGYAAAAARGLDETSARAGGRIEARVLHSYSRYGRDRLQQTQIILCELALVFVQSGYSDIIETCRARDRQIHVKALASKINILYLIPNPDE